MILRYGPSCLCRDYPNMKGEGKRPYFTYAISQLEALYSQSGSDPHILELLDQELSCRTSDRAGRLRATIATAMAILSTEQKYPIRDSQVTDVKQSPSPPDFN